MSDGKLPAQAEGSLPKDTQGQLQGAVERAMAAAGASGAIAGVWVPWAGSWVQGVGTSTPGGAAVSPDMTFAAGPVTRAMTCDVLYALVADHKVALDDSITDYVVGVPGLKDVTLQQLCDSTSGVAPYGDKLGARVIANPARPWQPKELIGYGLSASPAFPAGTSYQDSDTGYLLLGLAFERVTGKSVDELYDRYVFDPLDMSAASLPASPAKGADRLSGLYAPDGDGGVNCGAPLDVTGTDPSYGSTAAGVETDVDDLGRYVQALAAGARSYDTDKRFADPIALGADQPSWLTTKGGAVQAGSLIGQYGSYPGYLTAAFSDPGSGLAVVVVLNDSRASASLVKALSWQLAAIASTVPASDGDAPEAGLPWTADSVAAEVDANAVCPLP